MNSHQRRSQRRATDQAQGITAAESRLLHASLAYGKAVREELRARLNPPFPITQANIDASQA